jgi:3D-(3,5/4)-trihydroxycyclohexane-1,2-dione acylhydrolase (decyclizing)
MSIGKPTFLEKRNDLAQDRISRAKTIAKAGGILAARSADLLPRYIDVSVSEALILGLLLQDVSTYVTVFGHGSTEIGEVLRIYQQAGLVRVFGVRSEVEASHAAAALRWTTGEKAAVVTSIGPGALQALAASLVPASDGLGVWYILGDETSEDEGPNMQQIPHNEQALFLKLFSHMGQAYSLHTPLALPTALRRGLNVVDQPHWGGPFFMLLPMNVQAVTLTQFNLDELPQGKPPRLGAAADFGAYAQAADAILKASNILVRLGGGARQAGSEILEFLDEIDAVAITAPIALGVIPDNHPRNMTIGGSKGTISGNYAMENADLLVVIGSRAVCQSDCSRTGYPKVKHVININIDLEAATHYGKTTALLGDAGPTLRKLIETLQQRGEKTQSLTSDWFVKCSLKRQEWENFRVKRYNHPTLYDPVWGREILTQPAAIKAASDWAKSNQAVCFFDAGDVQANGFQIFESEKIGQIIMEGGASYMGFAVSALLATALTKEPFYGVAFSGDGSFTMNPQILLDGVEHGVQGCILLLDNRRMAAISGLQLDQYQHDFATNDGVEVDYVAWARAIKGVNALHGGYTTVSLLAALEQAKDYHGLSLVYIPVYFGPNELGGMGVFGRWNVGNWSKETQALRHKIGL